MSQRARPRGPRSPNVRRPRSEGQSLPQAEAAPPPPGPAAHITLIAGQSRPSLPQADAAPVLRPPVPGAHNPLSPGRSRPSLPRAGAAPPHRPSAPRPASIGRASCRIYVPRSARHADPCTTAAAPSRAPGASSLAALPSPAGPPPRTHTPCAAYDALRPLPWDHRTLRGPA